MDQKRQEGMVNLSHQKLKQNSGNTKIFDLSTENTYVPGKGVSKRSGLQKSKSNHDFSHRHPIHKGQTYLLSQDEEDEQEHGTMEPLSPHISRVGRQVGSSVRKRNHGIILPPSSQQILKQNSGNTKISDLSTENTYVPGKGVSKRSGLQKSKNNHDFSHRHPIHKGQTYLLSQDEEDEQEHGTMESFSPHISCVGRQVGSSVRKRNHGIILSPSSQQILKQNLGNTKISGLSAKNTYGPGKGVSKRSNLQNSKSSYDFSLRHLIHKSHYPLSQDEEDEQENGTMESCSPDLTRTRLQVDSSMRNWNQYEEEHLQEEHELEVDSSQIEIDTTDPQQHENNGSTSHGTKETRKESRGVTGTKKRRLNKEKLAFEVNECARIVGPDSQIFITKGGCIMREHAKFDGTTWKKQENSLKEDIIAKCTENSTFDPNCHTMADAMDSQLACQHRNKQHRLYKYYKTFPTKEEATTHPPNGIKVSDWVLLCERFASQEFQKMSLRNMKNRSFNEVPPAVGTVSIAREVDMKRRQGEEVSEIDNYKIAHFSKMKNKMVNEKADEILNDLRTEEAMSSCTPAEICLKKLHRIPGHRKRGSISTKENLATSNLRAALELEKAKSEALEEKVRLINEGHLHFQEEQIRFKEEQNKFQEKQVQFQEDYIRMKEQMGFMMKHLSRLSRLQSKKVGGLEDYNER